MQGYTALSWAYTALGVLETNYLVSHPERSLDLSPAVLQLQTWRDRYIRRINGQEDHLVESGAAIDAISLIRRDGLFPEESFPKAVKQWDGSRWIHLGLISDHLA